MNSMDYSSTNISFLKDSMTKKKPRNLSTDIFAKNTGILINIYMLRHAMHLIIIYEQVILFKRICSVCNKLKKRLTNLLTGW